MIRYCFDLDNTICDTKDGSYITAEPIPERIKKINDLYDAGHVVIIDTARGTMTGINWKAFTVKQLKDWGVKYHMLRVMDKIYADYYIDDCAINSEDFFK